MRRPGEILHDEIARLSVEATEANQPKWLVSLDMPTDTLFATTDDHSHTSLLAVLYGNRERATIADTDTPGVACVRTETPITVLGVSQQFMPSLIATLRANRRRGFYRQAGTNRDYTF